MQPFLTIRETMNGFRDRLNENSLKNRVAQQVKTVEKSHKEKKIDIKNIFLSIAGGVFWKDRKPGLKSSIWAWPLASLVQSNIRR